MPTLLKSILCTSAIQDEVLNGFGMYASLVEVGYGLFSVGMGMELVEIGHDLVLIWEWGQLRLAMVSIVPRPSHTCKEGLVF